MIIISTIAFLLIVSLYVNVNLYLKLRKSKTFIETKLYVEDDAAKFFKDILLQINEAYTNMKRIDKRGSFQSEDEVGFTFKALFSIVEGLTNKIKLIEQNINGESSEEKT